MANASADKLKNFGIRHGEKVVVGLTAALFVVFAALSFVKPTIDIKPDELKTAADNADKNLSRKQDTKDILEKLEKDGLKDPEFEKVVENQIANALKPGDYRAKLEWVTPEPGAGLIRDQPEVIAPTELAAFPGRGGILMYALDNKGERIIDAGDDKEKKKPPRRKRAPQSSMPSYGPPAGMAGPPPKEDNSPEAKQRKALEEKQRKEAFVGKVDPAKDKEKDQPEAAPPQGPWKEETHGKRWIVITGVIDNAQMIKNWQLALKNPAIAYPNYKRLDVERRTRQSDGTWSDWEAIDQNKNYEVLDNIPEIDTEYVPEPQRPAALVDPLPYLRAGYWSGVHVARLVPPEVLNAPAPSTAAPGASGMPGAGMAEMGRMSGAPPQGSMPMPGSEMGRGMSMPGMGSTGMSGASGEAEEMNFTKLDAPELMIRSLDFTVEPNTTYQFHVRIVVVNPNKDHTDVNPGVDVESKELLGPWSEETDPVMIPADVSTYAQAPEPTTRRDDLVAFQVIKWDPSTGQTVVKNDIAGPGELIGETGSVQMPSADGGGAKPAQIDFNSHAVVLDTYGGRQRIPDIGVERNPFEVPAVAMVVEPDGSVVIRSQARDKADEVRKDMDANYHQALKDSAEERKPGGGSSMPGPGGKKKKKKKR